MIGEGVRQRGDELIAHGDVECRVRCHDRVECGGGVVQAVEVETKEGEAVLRGFAFVPMIVATKPECYHVEELGAVFQSASMANWVVA